MEERSRVLAESSLTRFALHVLHFSFSPSRTNPMSSHLEKVVVILSTGRTGTKALAHFFNTSYDNVTALHEPAPSRHLRLLSNRAMARGMTPAGAVRAL